MIWVLLLFTQVWIGFEAVSWALKKRYGFLMKLHLGISFGMLFSASVYFLFSAFFGNNILHLVFHTIALSFVSFYSFFYRRRTEKNSFAIPSMITFSFLLVSYIISINIIPRVYFPQPRYLNIAVSLDISSEIALVTSFYSGSNSGFTSLFCVNNPVCFDCRSASRWITAFHSSMFMIGGASVYNSIVIPSVLSLASAIFLVFLLFNEVSQSEIISVLSVFLFFNASGFGFVRWFFAKSRYSSSTDYVNDLGAGLKTDWPHILFHYVLSNRSSPFILSFVSAILLLLYNEPYKKEMLLVGCLLGFLIPLEHQGFFSALVFVVIRVSSGLYFHEKGKHNSKLAILKYFGIGFGVTLAFFIIHYKKNDPRLDLIEFTFYWDDYTNKGYFFAPFVIWFVNLGSFFLLSVFFVWFYLDKKQRRFYFPAIAVFVFGNFFAFHPYCRTSTNYFIPIWVMLSSVMIMISLKKMICSISDEEVKGVILGISILLYASMTVSSLLGIPSLASSVYEAWSESDDKVASYIIKNTLKSSVFLSPRDIFDPASVLAGRQSFMSSQRQLYFQGYKWYTYSKELQSLLDNPNSNELPIISYALENSRKHLDNHLKKPDMKNSWKLCFAFESYQLFNRTK